MKNIGKYLRDSRRKRNESQAVIAGRAGISQQLVSRVEGGRGSIEQVLTLCRAIGIPVEFRIGRRKVPLVHALDPEERREIEANIDWFSRLSPGDRLRAARLHLMAIERLRKAAAADARRREDGGSHGS
jgi:transcriptional regulator with XRE-family HTH domain